MLSPDKNIQKQRGLSFSTPPEDGATGLRPQGGTKPTGELDGVGRGSEKEKAWGTFHAVCPACQNC